MHLSPISTTFSVKSCTLPNRAFSAPLVSEDVASFGDAVRDPVRAYGTPFALGSPRLGAVTTADQPGHL